MKVFCNSVNKRCVRKDVFIREERGGKRERDYNIGRGV